MSKTTGSDEVFKHSVAAARRQKYIPKMVTDEYGTYETYEEVKGDHTTSVPLDRKPQTKMNRKLK